MALRIVDRGVSGFNAGWKIQLGLRTYSTQASKYGTVLLITSNAPSAYIAAEPVKTEGYQLRTSTQTADARKAELNKKQRIATTVRTEGLSPSGRRNESLYSISVTAPALNINIDQAIKSTNRHCPGQCGAQEPLAGCDAASSS
jgi:hypothetical protein